MLFYVILVVVVVLPDPVLRMGTWSHSTDTQQLDNSPRSGPKIKGRKRGTKDGATELIRDRAVKQKMR